MASHSSVSAALLASSTQLVTVTVSCSVCIHACPGHLKQLSQWPDTHTNGVFVVPKFKFLDTRSSPAFPYYLFAIESWAGPGNEGT